MSKQKHYWLYVLKLENDKFYIGVTSKSPEERYLQHRNGYLAANWTKLHKPIAIEQALDLGFVTYEKAQIGENWATRRYIEAHGLDNVRGGDIVDAGRWVYKFRHYWTAENWNELRFTLYTLAFTLFVMVYMLFDISRHYQ